MKEVINNKLKREIIETLNNNKDLKNESIIEISDIKFQKGKVYVRAIGALTEAKAEIKVDY